MNRKNQHHHLIAASIATSTNTKYDKAYQQFIQYLHHRRLRLHRLTPLQLDDILVKYIHYLHSIQCSLSTATCTISAIHRATGVGAYLHRARLSIKGWQRIHARTRKHRPPLTREVTTLIAIVLAKSNHYSAALATLVSFHCYLRINEMCNLKIHEVAFAGDSRLGSGMKVFATLKLAVTKTGLNQSVSITDTGLASLLHRWICKLKCTGSVGSDTVFQLNANLYRSLFHTAVHSLSLSHIGYTPHSLRHGAATFDYMSGISIAEIVMKGRWASEASLKTYVQTGSVILLDTELSNHMFTIAKILDRHIVQVMNICQGMNTK